MKNTDKKKVFFICCLFILNMVSLPIIGLGALWPGGSGGEECPKKIGVFFWASDAGYFDGDDTYKAEIAAHVNDYANILIGEGYEKIFRFPDTSDLDELNFNFRKIDDYESEEDIIFFYFWGHGLVNLGVKLDSDGYYLNTNRLKLKLETLESKKIGFLVEACQSGNFVYHFLDKNYLTIASANYTHDGAIFRHAHEAYFSNYFWDGVGTLNYDAEQAFYNAGMWNIIIGWPLWPFQYSVYDNDLFEQTGYMFFED
jgi:hypothetical protein